MNRSIVSVLSPNHWSMRTSLVATILAMAVIGVVLVVVAGEFYRDLALDNQRKLLTEIIEMEVHEQLEGAQQRAIEVGTSIRADVSFRQALEQHQSPRLEAALVRYIERHAPMFARLNIKRTVVWDKDFRALVNLELNPSVSSSEILPCHAQIQRLKHGPGNGRTAHSLLCPVDGRVYLGTLMPIGSDPVQGYLQISTDAALDIKKLEKLLNTPLLINFTDGVEAYRSPQWVERSAAGATLRIDHTLRDARGDAYLLISLIFDVAAFQQKLKQTEGLILMGAALITLVAVLIALLLLQKTTLQPLGALTQQLRLVGENQDHLGEQVRVSGNKELCQLATHFNAVSTELRELYQKLEKLAFTDALTGLPNRELFYDRLTQLILLARRVPGQFSLFVMDLDRFKYINDTLGHQVGDELLRQAGARLHDVVRETDTIARLGGDEFAALLPKVVDTQGAIIVAERMHAALAEPFIIDGHQLNSGISIGVVMHPYHGENQHELMQRADVAMYHAKQNQMGYAFYETEIDKHNVLELTLETELKHAINNDSLKLFYQPKIIVDSGEVYGAEALLRWIHPERGFIPPDAFIPMAEQTGLIHPLTKWVLKTAVRQAKQWHERGMMLNVAINLSAQSLRDPGLIETIESTLREVDMAPHYLTLELTETAVMSDPRRALDILTELDQKGVMLSIDDFGTGYSSLAYLKQLPMDELKIDRSFVMEMDKDKNDAVIVHSTIDLAHNMGLKVVAEGVETDQAWHTLKALGCDMGQGYFMCKPVDADTFMEWLDSSAWHPPKQQQA